MLPWKEETFAEAQARFSAALVPDTDSAAAMKDLTLAPGANRRHVFDFDCKIRVIASTDSYGPHRFLHLSFSNCPDKASSGAATLKKLAYQLADQLIGPRTIKREVITDRALHLFYDP